MFVILEPISFVYVVAIKEKLSIKRVNGYIYRSALNTDRFGNYEFSSLFNAILIKENGHQFGNFDQTISHVLGRNKLKGTLSKTGKILDKILDIIDKNHTIKSL